MKWPWVRRSRITRALDYAELCEKRLREAEREIYRLDALVFEATGAYK